MKQLDKLLFEQGGDCFFCKQPLAKADASIEHLFAQSNGGTHADENVVACCKTLNALLGNRPLKEKFQIVLRQKGTFRCPADLGKPVAPEVVAPAPAPAPAVAPVPAPRIAKPPASSVAAPVVRKQASAVRATVAASTAARHSVTCPTCWTAVPAAPGQLDHVCPKCRGVFRY